VIERTAMKAFRIEAKHQAAFCALPEPKLKPEQVLLKPRIVGFCGSDLATYLGVNPLVTYPRIPGHEIAAEIVAVGSDVPEDWRAGMIVTLSPYSACGKCPACRAGRTNCCQFNQTMGVQRDGALADLITAAWQRLFTSPRLAERELALVEPLTVGCHAADRASITAYDTVAVLGCGAVGLGAVAAAAYRNAKVIAIDLDDGKLETARKAGAAHCINSCRAKVHDELSRLTDNEGPSVIIEAIGLPETFQLATAEVSFAGRVVYIGYAKREVEYETRQFVQKELDIRGSRNATDENFRQVIRLLESGRFPVSDVISRTVPFDECGDALSQWSEHRPTTTKVLIQF